MSFLCSLGTNPLSDMCLGNIFFYHVGCLSISLAVSFAVHKIFSVMQSHLFIFAFIAWALGVILKKTRLPRPMSRRFSLMLF